MLISLKDIANDAVAGLIVSAVVSLVGWVWSLLVNPLGADRSSSGAAVPQLGPSLPILALRRLVIIVLATVLATALSVPVLIPLEILGALSADAFLRYDDYVTPPTLLAFLSAWAAWLFYLSRFLKRIENRLFVLFMLNFFLALIYTPLVLGRDLILNQFQFHVYAPASAEDDFWSGIVTAIMLAIILILSWTAIFKGWLQRWSGAHS